MKSPIQVGPFGAMFVVWALAAISGCAGQRSALETLEESLQYFHTHVKAGEIEQASAYVAIEAMDHFLALHDPERNIFVMEEFSVRQVSGDPSSGLMEVRTTANVRKRNSLTIRTIKYHETWEKREGRWMLIKEEIIKPNQGFVPFSRPHRDDRTH
ncbi:MAG: hypothetical protein GXP54_02500 [Deltaproteobacteria bacterium]|nr:hypothetical protein [Deltaproteobacteria bacterium]